MEGFANRHQGSRFDSMEDIYRSVRSPGCEVFGGADCVSCNRDGS